MIAVALLCLLIASPWELLMDRELPAWNVMMRAVAMVACFALTITAAFEYVLSLL